MKTEIASGNQSANAGGHDDVVDVEEYFSTGRSVPKALKYRIRVDKVKYVVTVTEMRGREILAVASKTPEKYLLRQKLRSGVEEVKPDQIVSFLTPGIERFMTIPNEVTEGEGPQARWQFKPLAQDIAYMDSTGLFWEAVVEGGVKALIFHNWPLPTGYNVPHAHVHVRLTDGYPDAQIDMAYFHPPLHRVDGRGINSLTNLHFDGQLWQQWSRHRTSASAWRADVDDLSTHMALVQDWLAAELRK